LIKNLQDTSRYLDNVLIL